MFWTIFGWIVIALVCWGLYHFLKDYEETIGETLKALLDNASE